MVWVWTTEARARSWIDNIANIALCLRLSGRCPILQRSSRALSWISRRMVFVMDVSEYNSMESHVIHLGYAQVGEDVKAR